MEKVNETKLSILMQNRINAFTLPGGDTVQMVNTREEIIAKGHKVDIKLELTPRLDNYDLVHLFNLTRIQETYMHVRNAVKQGKPIALSTIYWPTDELEKTAVSKLRRLITRAFGINNVERLKALYKFIFNGERHFGNIALIIYGYKRLQKYVINHVSIFLPNADLEYSKLKENFILPNDKYIVVPNAVNIDSLKKAENNEDTLYNIYRDYIICVGRIEPRKNQLALIEAIKDTDYKLLIIGKMSSNNINYGKKVFKEIAINKNITYIEKVSNEEIYNIYKNCRISVLPSWYETPGLVSLEAAAMGINIVVSDKGTTKEYFGDYAYYCNSKSINSIRESIDNAFWNKPNQMLKKLVMDNYNWSNAADKTIQGYFEVLGSIQK